MSSNDPHDTPTDAVAENGIVFLDGPGGIAASLTPKAAAESGKRISSAAELAARQKRGEPAADAKDAEETPED